MSRVQYSTVQYSTVQYSKITNIYKSSPFKVYLYVSIDTLFIVNSDGFISILERQPSRL